MCDCPAASVFVTHESVKKGWFIFAECRTEDGNVTLTCIKVSSVFLAWLY